MDHKIFYCQGCECYTLLCKTCGNNGCNGGYGEINGAKCPDCLDAARVEQELAPRFKKMKAFW